MLFTDKTVNYCFLTKIGTNTNDGRFVLNGGQSRFMYGTNIGIVLLYTIIFVSPVCVDSQNWKTETFTFLRLGKYSPSPLRYSSGVANFLNTMCQKLLFFFFFDRAMKNILCIYLYFFTYYL